jgi:hypothetical protein
LILLIGAAFALDTSAIVGAPATPVSVAGVARRTTRRTVAVASTATAAAATSAAQASAASAQASAAAASASAASASAASAQAAGAPPVGTIVTALPPGCAQVQVNGVAYSNCGGVYYRAAFQGENLVYVVEKP